MHRFALLIAAPLTLAVVTAGPIMAADAPPVVSSNGQNFTMSTDGDLRIEGRENQYDIILPSDVLFDFDRSKLRPEASALLAKVKAHLDRHGSSQIHVRGYTDSKGSDQYNLTLSINRANAVCKWLKANGHNFTNCIGRGENEPIAANTNPDGSDNPQGRQQNRRVTISVVKYPSARDMIERAREQAGSARQWTR